MAGMSPLLSNAQSTGSFNHTIVFMGESRTLACYVPTDYDPDNSYNLIVALHGLGDLGTSYRNAIVGPLGFAASHPNTILVCPDGGSDALSDFYTPVGDEAIIQSSIDFAREQYNIDTANIVLQGFSLGGARALQYGLEHTHQFKGLLLNTPAIQGVKDAVTQFADGGLYNYEHAAEIPVYITHGADDVLYTAPIDSMYEQLVRNNSAVKLARFTGMGHTVPALSEIEEYKELFEEWTPDEYDAALVKVNIAARTCGTTTVPSVLVQNKGSEALTSIRFTYNDGTNNYAYTWNGTLAPLEHADINLPAVSTVAGNHDLNVGLDTLNLSTLDEISGNNAATAPFRLVTEPKSLPYTTDFADESYDEDWLLQPSGDYLLPWSWDEETESIITANTIFIFNNAGRKEEILSPVLDLSSLSSPFVTFDVAYAYTQYSAAVFGVDTVFADTLEVLISTDCGETYESIYKKGGEDLLTYATPVTDPLNFDAQFVVPEDGDWRKETIDLSPWATSEHAVVKFSLTSALGGLTLLDNIAFVNEATATTELSVSADISVYPNPATDQVTVTTGQAIIKEVTIVDMAGRVLIHQKADAPNASLNATGLSSGTYLLLVETDKGKGIQRLVISR